MNFDERPLGTYVWVEYKNAVIDFQCKNKTLSEQEREGICAFLEARGPEAYFAEGGRTISAVSGSVLVDDLTGGGFSL